MEQREIVGGILGRSHVFELNEQIQVAPDARFRPCHRTKRPQAPYRMTQAWPDKTSLNQKPEKGFHAGVRNTRSGLEWPDGLQKGI